MIYSAVLIKAGNHSIKMQLAPEIKKQLEEQKKQCIFCRLISGEIPNAKKVFEDDKTIALLDIYPALKGHTLFMLKEHYPLPMYASQEELAHKFSLISDLSKALKSALIKTGMNIFITLGGVAGQQSYHFMAHLLPRENGDGFYNFLLKKGAKNGDQEKMIISDLLHKAMQKETLSQFSPTDEGMVIYEDEKVRAIIPNNASAKGQVTLYSKKESQYIEKLSQEDSAYLFFTASMVSKVVFEAVKAQGTNILLMSGESDDNPSGALAIHILPRWQDDGLQGLIWEPKRPSYNLDDVASKIKDKAWNVKFEGKIKKEITADSFDITPNAQKEIMKAIQTVRSG